MVGVASLLANGVALGASVDGRGKFDPAVAEGLGVGAVSAPSALPVMVARFGADEAVEVPMVAYALPSARAKKGRGAGDSAQQFTCWASALQHQLLSWSEHCVIDSAPAALMSIGC